ERAGNVESRHSRSLNRWLRPELWPQDRLARQLEHVRRRRQRAAIDRRNAGGWATGDRRRREQHVERVQRGSAEEGIVDREAIGLDVGRMVRRALQAPRQTLVTPIPRI